MSNEVIKRELTQPVQNEVELANYLNECPILDPKHCSRVHMQVVIVHAFYNYPDITNEELTQLILARFPESTWANDPTGRANTDRRKFNAGAFRCMGGWMPEGPEDAHYAMAVSTPNSDETIEEDSDA